MKTAITNRRREAARRVPAATPVSLSRETHLSRLEEMGIKILRRAVAPPADLFERPRPKLRKGASAVSALLQERRSGR